MSKNRLYALTLCACTGGWVWLLLADARDTDFTLCLFKLVTHIPCPACGSTRAAQCLLHGNLHNALLINPLGVITALCMAVFPSWILIDRTLNRPTFYQFYCKIETVIRQHPAVAILLCVLIFANWLWNIFKGI